MNSHGTRRTPARLVAAAVATLLLLTGCGPTLGDLPLPGSGVSGDTVRLTAEFDEALNLAEGAIVKVNGVDAGRVQGVSVEDFHARAEILVQTGAEVRQGATARLRYNTPLGELFVDITNPPSGQVLGEGSVLTTEVTSTAPTVEDALASASLLINGGGLGQLQNVTEELNKVFTGREETVRDLLAQSNQFLSQANATTTDIGRALDALNQVSRILRERQETIHRALVEIRPASEVIRANTEELTRLLVSLRTFSGNANEVVNATRTQLLHLIRESAPVLAEFNRNSGRFGPGLTDLVRLARSLDEIVPTDYANLGLILPLDMTTVPGTGGGGGGGGGGPIPTIPGDPLPTLPLPSLPLPTGSLPTILPTILPTLPVTRDDTSGASGTTAIRADRGWLFFSRLVRETR